MPRRSARDISQVDSELDVTSEPPDCPECDNKSGDPHEHPPRPKRPKRKEGR